MDFRTAHLILQAVIEELENGFPGSAVKGLAEAIASPEAARHYARWRAATLSAKGGGKPKTPFVGVPSSVPGKSKEDDQLPPTLKGR